MSDYASSIEWAEDTKAVWSKRQVLKVLTDHSQDIHDIATMDDFSAACQPCHITTDGTRYFRAADVLRWLGY